MQHGFEIRDIPVQGYRPYSKFYNLGKIMSAKSRNSRISEARKISNSEKFKSPGSESNPEITEKNL